MPERPAQDALYRALTDGVQHAQIRQHHIDQHAAEVRAEFAARLAAELRGCCSECDTCIEIAQRLAAEEPQR